MRRLPFAQSLLSLGLLPLGLLMATGPAFAQAPGVQVVRAWARAPVGGGTAALYLTLHDSGAADRLTSVSTDASEMAMLHQSVNENGVEEMLPLQAIALPAGGTVTMQPGGVHVMLMDMNRKLHAGDTLHATLTFDHSPPITVSVPVLAPGAPGPQ